MKDVPRPEVIVVEDSDDEPPRRPETIDLTEPVDEGDDRVSLDEVTIPGMAYIYHSWLTPFVSFPTLIKMS